MDKVIRAIFHQEGVACQDIQALPGGQVNQVFLVDSKYVIRIGQREDAFARLKYETGLIQGLAVSMPVPKILAFGMQNGVVYQIQQYIPGRKLYMAWKDLQPYEQETISTELSAALQSLHSRVFPDFGSPQPGANRFSTWPGYLLDKFHHTLEEIQALNIQIVPGFIDMAVNYFEKHQHVLNGGFPTLVHGDLTLVNILVDQGRLSAVLDFEYAIQAPADYELWVIEAFCLYPNDWADQDQGVFCSADFANFCHLLEKHYPKLFETPDLRQRMNLYQIDAALGSYLAWRKANLTTIPPDQMAAKEFYMARITNFIFDSGARMFIG